MAWECDDAQALIEFEYKKVFPDNAWLFDRCQAGVKRSSTKRFPTDRLPRPSFNNK